MAPRSSWKGYLKLSLVSCPVALFAATSKSEKVSFNQLHGTTGNRVKQQYVDAETGDVVARDEMVKGYEVAKGEYVIVTDDEIADLKIESSNAIEIEQFVPRGSIDSIYEENHYYLAPDDKVGEEAFAIIRAAMEKSKVVGVARVVLFGKERVITLDPHGKGIRIASLRHDYEVRKAAAYFDDLPAVEPSKEMLDLATHLVEQKKGTFDPGAFKDRYQDAIVELIRAKQKGEKPKPIADARPKAGVVDLMAALRASLGAAAPAAPAAEASSPAAVDATEKPAAKAKADPLVGKAVHVRQADVRAEEGEVVAVAFDPPAVGRVLSVDGDVYRVDFLEAHDAFAEADAEFVRDGKLGMATASGEDLSALDRKGQGFWKETDALEGEGLRPTSALKAG